jgi:putative ABC transport system permease protein
MPLLEAIRLALQQIRVQKLKSFFTLLGVMIGVMFLIAVVSIVEGMGRYMEEDFAGKMLGVNTFTLRRMPWFSGGNMTEAEWRRVQRHPRFYAHDLQTIKDALPDGTRYAVDCQEQVYATSRYARPRQVEIHAVEGDYFTIKRYDLASGRVFTAQEAEHGATVVVIGNEVAERFFPDLDPLGRELRIGGIPYTVIGLIEKQGTLFGMSLDKIVIGPFRSPLHRLTNPRGDIDGIMVKSATATGMLDAMEGVREAMRARRKLRPAEPDNFVMETSQTALQEFNEIKTVMTMAGTLLPAIGLVVGGMVIMNIMLVAVAERTREIGIRKSLGARRRDILWQFLIEAATLSTLGAVLGIILGISIAKGLSWKFPFLPAAVAPWSLVMATLLGTVVGILSGVLPARKAARLDPIAALRQE